MTFLAIGVGAAATRIRRRLSAASARRNAGSGLRDLLPAIECERARRETRTRVRRLSTGDWDVAAAEEPDAHHRGFLIVDGLISREVEVLGRRCVELIGAGDVIRPWSCRQTGR
jgi:CRP/FNR family transcriptional regulator, cyclic AMP receptor protein